MIKILGETIKSAFIAEIVKEFPGITTNKETVTNPAFPNIFIEQLTLTRIEDRKDKFWLCYLLTARYRVTPEISLKLDLQENLDAAALKFMVLSKLDISGRSAKIKNARTEKIDGVLHYFCNVDRLVDEVNEIEAVKQWVLKEKIHIERS